MCTAVIRNRAMQARYQSAEPASANTSLHKWDDPSSPPSMLLLDDFIGLRWTDQEREGPRRWRVVVLFFFFCDCLFRRNRVGICAVWKSTAGYLTWFILSNSSGYLGVNPADKPTCYSMHYVVSLETVKMASDQMNVGNVVLRTLDTYASIYGQNCLVVGYWTGLRTRYSPVSAVLPAYIRDAARNFQPRLFLPRSYGVTQPI